MNVKCGTWDVNSTKNFNWHKIGDGRSTYHKMIVTYHTVVVSKYKSFFLFLKLKFTHLWPSKNIQISVISN